MIDSRAIVDSGAQLADSVTVGPFSIIGENVEIGEGCWIGPHVVIRGPCKIGKNNKIYQFSSIGDEPQDKKYKGEPTLLEIGDNNVIREHCTINRGTVQGGGVTRLGNNNWVMVGVHVAHDCLVGNDAIFANNASLAGHVTVGDFAILGGFTLVHQFCAIGEHSFTAMASVISKDVPPYVLVSGHMAKPHGLNIEGLKRRNFSEETIRDLRRAYKILYKSNLVQQQALIEIKSLAKTCPEAEVLYSFVEKSSRGIVR